jgi:hypothetical protein
MDKHTNSNLKKFSGILHIGLRAMIICSQNRRKYLLNGILIHKSFILISYPGNIMMENYLASQIQVPKDRANIEVFLCGGGLTGLFSCCGYGVACI